jgi:uncharacterized membrane protein YvbJ
MILCTSCGTENQEKSKFCQNCGSSLEVQSTLVQVKKSGSGESKFSPTSREERFRKAKIIALKAIKDQESTESKQKSQVVYLGEKIL